MDANHQIATGYNVDKALTMNTNLVDIDGFQRPQTYTSAKSSSNTIYTSRAPNAANFSVKIKRLSVLRSIDFITDSDVDTTLNLTDVSTGAITSANDKTATFSSSTSSNTVGKLLQLNFRFGIAAYN